MVSNQGFIKKVKIFFDPMKPFSNFKCLYIKYIYIKWER